MTRLSIVKKLIRKNRKKFFKKFLKNQSKFLLKESIKNENSFSKEESYMIYENKSDLIIKVNVQLKKDMGEEGDEQMQIFHLNNFLKSTPDKILKFLNLEKIDEDKTIGFK